MDSRMGIEEKRKKERKEDILYCLLSLLVLATAV